MSLKNTFMFSLLFALYHFLSEVFSTKFSSLRKEIVLVVRYANPRRVVTAIRAAAAHNERFLRPIVRSAIGVENTGARFRIELLVAEETELIGDSSRYLRFVHVQDSCGHGAGIQNEIGFKLTKPGG